MFTFARLLRAAASAFLLCTCALAQGHYEVGPGPNDWVDVNPNGTWVDGYGLTGSWLDTGGNIDLLNGNVLDHAVGAAIGDSDYINTGPAKWCRTA